MSVLISGCTTLTKSQEKSLDDTCRRMLRTVLTNPGRSAQQNSYSTATYFPSQKTYKSIKSC